MFNFRILGQIVPALLSALTACAALPAKAPAAMPSIAILLEASPPRVVKFDRASVKTAFEIPIAREPAKAVLPPPEPAVDDDPARLMGLASDVLTALLGAPNALREDADAQVWQYRAGECVLDIYLYKNAAYGPHQVTYYEFRGSVPDRSCLRGLLLAQASL